MFSGYFDLHIEQDQARLPKEFLGANFQTSSTIVDIFDRFAVFKISQEELNDFNQMLEQNYGLVDTEKYAKEIQAS